MSSSLNHDSSFVAAYEKGMKKSEYWSPTFDDSLDLIAKLPSIVARIFHNTYRNGPAGLPKLDMDADLIENFNNALGYGDNEGMKEYLRLYIALHADVSTFVERPLRDQS